MEHLKSEQLILLQQNLTYETYEQFVNMFDKDEKIPEGREERNNFIIETMKTHEFWGEIYGWGNKRVYKRIPKYDNSDLRCIGPYGIFAYSIGKTKSELIKFLDGFRDLVSSNTLKIPTDCLPVEETFQVPMFERWKNDSMCQ